MFAQGRVGRPELLGAFGRTLKRNCTGVMVTIGQIGERRMRSRLARALLTGTLLVARLRAS